MATEQTKLLRQVNIWQWTDEGCMESIGKTAPITCIFHEWGKAYLGDHVITVGVVEQPNTGKVYLALPDDMNFLDHLSKIER